MQITFMIGNGFDLKLGMKTSYSDVYNSYINTSSTSPIIRGFKNELRKDAPNGYTTWGDFEMAMARYAQNFKTEADFVSCVRDFKSHMANHLDAENLKMLKSITESDSMKFICSREISSSFLDFYKGQDQNTIYTIKSIINASKIQNTYRFITFNYTTVLDRLCEMANGVYLPYAPIHIHGDLGHDIALGVDGIEQFGELQFTPTRSTARAFIKPLYNEMFDRNRVSEALKCISNSEIICVYGLSLGDSDRTWRKALIEWLNVNSNHHLFYFIHNTKIFNHWNRDAIMDEEDILKESLINRLGCQDKAQFEEQIHIPVSYDIFNIAQQIKQRKEAKERLETAVNNA